MHPESPAVVPSRHERVAIPKDPPPTGDCRDRVLQTRSHRLAQNILQGPLAVGEGACHLASDKQRLRDDTQKTQPDIVPDLVAHHCAVIPSRIADSNSCR